MVEASTDAISSAMRNGWERKSRAPSLYARRQSAGVGEGLKKIVRGGVPQERASALGRDPDLLDQARDRRAIAPAVMERVHLAEAQEPLRRGHPPGLSFGPVFDAAVE